jgi:hypothetical protein
MSCPASGTRHTPGLSASAYGVQDQAMLARYEWGQATSLSKEESAQVRLAKYKMWRVTGWLSHSGDAPVCLGSLVVE